jgi:hypothetical protein
VTDSEESAQFVGYFRLSEIPLFFQYFLAFFDCVAFLSVIQPLSLGRPSFQRTKFMSTPNAMSTPSMTTHPTFVHRPGRSSPSSIGP